MLSKKKKYLNKNKLRRRGSKKKNKKFLLKGGDKTDKDIITELGKQLSFFPTLNIPMDAYANTIENKIKKPHHNAKITYRSYKSYSVKSQLGEALEKINPEKDISSSIENLTQSMEYFQSLDDENLQKSKILYCLTHSGLPHPRDTNPYCLVPPNISICFLNPIQHFGIFKENHIFTDIPAGELGNRKQLFSQLFSHGQKIDSHDLQYKSFKPINTTQYISLMNLGSWYYPGQLVPNVVMCFSKEEIDENKKLGLTYIGYPQGDSETKPFTTEEDELCVLQLAQQGKFKTKLFPYLIKLQNPNFRYIIIIKGCRSMPYHNVKGGNPINLNFYHEMMEREIYYSNLNRNLVSQPVLTPYDKQLSRHIPRNHFANVVEFFIDRKDPSGLDYTMIDKIYANHKNLHLLSRFNKVYLDIYENSQIRLLTDNEINFLRLNSTSKAILYLIKVFQDNSDLEEGSLLKKNIDAIMDGFYPNFTALYSLKSLIEYVGQLEEKNNLQIEHPIISDYLFNIYLTQTQNLTKLFQYLKSFNSNDTIEKLYLTQNILAKLGTEGYELNKYFDTIKCVVLEKDSDIVSEKLSLFRNLNYIIIKKIIFSNPYASVAPQGIKLIGITHLKVNQFVFSKDEDLLEIINHFPNLIYIDLKIIIPPENPIKIIDLTSLDSLSRLQELKLDSLDNVLMVKINSSSLKKITLEKKASSLTVIGILPTVKNLDFRIENIDITNSIIKGNQLLESIALNSSSSGNPVLQIFKEEKYLCTTLKMNLYSTIVNDLKKFTCDSIHIQDDLSHPITLEMFQGLLYCDTDSLLLSHCKFNYQPQDDFSKLIPDLISSGNKKIIIKDSEFKELKKFLLSMGSLASNILFQNTT